MRILHYLSEIDLSHGGVVRSVLDLSDSLARAGHEVTLLTFEPQDLPPAWTENTPGAPRAMAVPWPRYPKSFRRFEKQTLARIRPLIAEADVIHLHVPWEGTNIQISRIARSLGKPYILSTHGMLDDWAMARNSLTKHVYLRFIARSLISGAAALHCTAEGERREVLKRVDSPVEVLPLILDVSLYNSLPGPEIARERFPVIRGAGHAVLYLGRLFEAKGIETLIDAVALLIAKGRPVRLLIAGVGDPSYVATLRDRIAAAGIGGHAELLGPVFGADKVSLFQAADLVVLPSVHENFGFVAVEALASAAPAVISRGFQTWAELEASGGVAVADLAPESVASTIADLLDKPEQRRAMGLQGRAFVFAWLDPSRLIEQYASMYERAVHTARRRDA